MRPPPTEEGRIITLDDVNLGGTVKTVASDVVEIIRAGSEIGLSLNVSKCELIAHKDFQVDDALLQSFHRLEFEDVSLLGAPLFPGVALDTAWDDRCEDLARAVDRLSTIGSQDALILLRSSLALQKFSSYYDVVHRPTILSASLMDYKDIPFNKLPIF